MTDLSEEVSKTVNVSVCQGDASYSHSEILGARLSGRLQFTVARANAGEDVEKPNHSRIAGGNAKRTRLSGKQVGSFFKS